MKRCISVFVISSYLFFIFSPSVVAQQSSMKVLKVKGDKCIANMGAIHNIAKNSYYVIVQNNANIGKAKVIAVREKICALKIISLNFGAMVEQGDLLIPDNESYSESDAFLDELESQEFSKEKLSAPKSYFYEGQKAAESEYNGGGAMIGGLVSGTLLGLIGWGLGYAILSSSDINVPPHHLSKLNSQQQFEFITGYKQKAKRKRNGNFHAGAAIGILIVVGIVISPSN